MTTSIPFLLQTIRGKALSRPSVWLMRQAGRYLPEYQHLKSKYSFLEMCRTPELALEISLQPIRRFDMDAAIVFADILLPLEAMGMKIDFAPGPKIESPLKSLHDIRRLHMNDPAASLHYVMNTLRQLRAALPNEKAVIGFAGAPWTMACYALDQGPYKHFQGTQVFAYENREVIHELLGMLSDFTIAYLLAQLENGADIIQLFDSWGGILNAADYEEFSLPYNAKVLSALRARGHHTILYVNGSAHLLEALKQAGAHCISIDAKTSLTRAQSVFGDSTVVQGNFDPAHLFGSIHEVRTRTLKMLGTVENRAQYIANLGHGVLQRTPPENVAMFVETIKAGWE